MTIFCSVIDVLPPSVHFVSFCSNSSRLLIEKEAKAIRALWAQYEDVPMSLADACLVRMAELQPSARVFTLDSDFMIYRKNGKEPIPLVCPQ